MTIKQFIKKWCNKIRFIVRLTKAAEISDPIPLMPLSKNDHNQVPGPADFKILLEDQPYPSIHKFGYEIEEDMKAYVWFEQIYIENAGVIQFVPGMEFDSLMLVNANSMSIAFNTLFENLKVVRTSSSMHINDTTIKQYVEIEGVLKPWTA